MAQATGRTARAPWYSTERTQGLLLAAALLLLDLLPIEAWLLILAGAYAGGIARAALPFAFLVAAFLASALVARVLRRSPALLSSLAVLALVALLLPVAMRVSPAAYGDVPGGPLDTTWLVVLANDLTSDGSRWNVVFSLAALLALLGWRGAVFGRGLPGTEAVLGRFKVSAAGVVLAAAAATALTGQARAEVIGVLAGILPLSIFAGLVAAALAHAADARSAQSDGGVSPSAGSRWLGMALVLAGVVVGVALLISVAISFDNVSAALRALGPVGAALDAALRWLVYGFAQILFFLLGGLLEALKHAVQNQQTTTPPQQPAQPPPPGGLSGLPAQWIFIAQLALAALAMIALIATAIALLRYALGQPRMERDAAVAEEREALDGRSLLRAQVRDLLRRRRRRASAPPAEALPAGSVRALYREVLRAAAARGLARAPAETPDEYAPRVGSVLAGTVEAPDLTRISGAYDEARYGEREPAADARDDVRQRTGRVLRALRHGRR
jgi:hypothetical protein